MIDVFSSSKHIYLLAYNDTSSLAKNVSPHTKLVLYRHPMVKGLKAIAVFFFYQNIDFFL